MPLCLLFLSFPGETLAGILPPIASELCISYNFLVQVSSSTHNSNYFLSCNTFFKSLFIAKTFIIKNVNLQNSKFKRKNLSGD